MFAYALAILLRQTEPDILANAREAVNIANAKPWGETILTGKAEVHGTPATYRLRFTSDGRYLEQVTSQLGESTGFDGKKAWAADASGASHEIHFQEADDEMALELLISGRWLDSDAPVDLTANGNVVNLKLKGTNFEEAITLDPATNLPTSVSYNDTAGPTTIALSDWHPAGSKKVAFKYSVSSGGMADTFTIEKASGAKDPGAAAFSIPDWKATDTTFDPTKPADIEVKRAISGHVLVHPLVNGKDVGWFIFDSGAEIMVIDPAAADGINLPKVGTEQLVGVGGVEKSSFRIAKDFELGPMKIQDIKFAEFDLKQISTFFHVKVAGVVGYDVFRRAVISLDLGKPKMAIYNPKGYQLTTGAWTPFIFDSGNPVVEASYEGDHKGLFRLDTGANGTVTFHSPTVTSEHLLENRPTHGVMTGGVGGMSTSKMGALKYFELGGHRFENVQAVFSEAKSGAFTDGYLAGNIGQDFLLPFTLIFDFGNSRIAFVPH